MYKRQIQLFPGQGGEQPPSQIQGLVNGAVFIKAPVSYTHLDVYKRQAEAHRLGERPLQGAAASKDGQQVAFLEGAFTEPVGLCGVGNNVFVLDAQRNAITVFELTPYGETLHTAIDIYTDGRYQDCLLYTSMFHSAESPFPYVVLGYSALSLP